MLLLSWENYENSKGEIEDLAVSTKHAHRDVQKSVHGDGKGNDNCIKGGPVSIITCIRCM